MKFEVDLNDRSQLIKAQAELKRVLAIVEYALNEGQSGGNGSPIPLLAASASLPQGDQPVIDAIKHAAAEFTTSEIYNTLGVKIADRARVRQCLERATSAGIIRLVEERAGRRPGRYAKVSP